MSLLDIIGDRTMTTAQIAAQVGLPAADVEAACGRLWHGCTLDRVLLPSGPAWRRATVDRWHGAMPIGAS